MIVYVCDSCGRKADLREIRLKGWKSLKLGLTDYQKGPMDDVYVDVLLCPDCISKFSQENADPLDAIRKLIDVPDIEVICKKGEQHDLK